MALLPQKLRILTFPQRINGNQLELRALVIPTQMLLNIASPFESVLNPGTTIDLPAFIKANLQLEIKTIKGLSGYPFTDQSFLDDGVTVDSFPTTISFPSNIAAIYEGLAAEFKPDTVSAATVKGAGAPSADGIRKYLPKSYRASFNFTNPRTPFAKTDDSYHCAIKNTDDKNPAFSQSKNDIIWGRIIAFCLRQPLLAEKMGLLYKWTLELPAANYFKNGGWVYFNLLSDLADFSILPANKETELKQYAARIPAITNPRPLFGALLFPVVKGPTQPNGDFDTLKIEAADYDDGFAKIVHAVQPVSANILSEEPDGIHVQKEAGIRLGWDDEQLLIWQNRQMMEDPAAGERLDAPLGAFSYRVDVRQAGQASWNSLVNTQSKADLVLRGQAVAPAGTIAENGVQVFPSSINGTDPRLWLPSYFTQWYGASLVLPDDKAATLDVTGALADPGKYSDANIPANPDQKNGLYRPLLPENCELKYGNEYEFRVRLSDLAGGGPILTEEAQNDAPAASASIVFKRYIAPKQLKINPLDAQPDPDSKAVKFYAGDNFDIYRPRLGYPALLFTQMDTATAFQKLVDDRDFLHTGKAGLEKIKEQRDVSFFDPDTDKMLVLVELKTIKMDNMASLNQKEAYIPLYKTLRSFPADPAAAFRLQLEYRNANVIDFGNEVNLGDLNISQAAIDVGNTIVVPTSRDIRITLLPVCSDKKTGPAYFGFAKTLFAETWIRTGEPIQFFVREDAVEEPSFFKKDLESKQLQGIYLQPDTVQVFNKQTLVTELVAGKEASQNSVMQRLTTQLGLGCTGLSLVGNPGERIHFGCSNRIRHTLAPDGSSISFASNAELFNHWVCVLSYEIQRDWTWDGLSAAGIEIKRHKQFTDEAATVEDEIVGSVELKRTASRLCTEDPDRSYTRIVFIDAVEPKKDITKPSTTAQPFPNTIDVEYTLTPQFINSVSAASSNEQVTNAGLQLPTTIIPKQVPKVVAAGIALSPYAHNDNYSETVTRERYLWFEFDAPIDDPNDTYFARVLTYAPDPLLSYSNVDQLLVKQDDPPLPIPDETIRVITKDHGNDNAGLDAMQLMTAETQGADKPLIKVSATHYLLPLPTGLHNESLQLFGFFTYELRVGHTQHIWCTAQGRFGHPARVNGVQHPAPALKCLVNRDEKGILLSAQYAQAVFNGKNVTSKPPKTEIWCMLYAQVKQADGKQNRNLLLAETMLQYRQTDEALQIGSFLAKRGSMSILDANRIKINLDIPSTGRGGWTDEEIAALLEQFNLDGDTGLSVLAVEMMPRYEQYIYKPDYAIDYEKPLSEGLGNYRILRTSRLVAAPEVCCENCG